MARVKTPILKQPAQYNAASSTVTSVVSFALANGLTVDEALETTGCEFSELLNPQSHRSPDNIIHDILGALSQKRPDIAIPIVLGSSAPANFLAGLEVAMLYGTSLRDTLKLLVHCKELLANRLELSFEESGSYATFSIKHPNDEIDNGIQCMTGLAITWEYLKRQIRTPFVLSEFRSGHDCQGARSHYEEFFNAKVNFSTSETALIIPVSALDEPFEQANQEAFNKISDHFHELVLDKSIQRIESKKFKTLQAALYKQANIPGTNINTVVSEIGMSLRTAQRIVKKHGFTLSEMINQARLDFAKNVMQENSDTSIEEVAYCSGYSDPRVFRRVFKRMLGMSPSDFRKSLTKYRCKN